MTPSFRSLLAAALAVVLFTNALPAAETRVKDAPAKETKAERCPHEVVARGPLRHVHPLGPL